MKTLLALPLVLAGTALAHAANPPQLSFESKSLDTPPLRFGDSLANGTLTMPPLPPGRMQPEQTAATIMRSAAITPRYTSRMPVVEPRKDVDYKLTIVPPDPAIDAKMVVKEPAVESAK